MHLLEMISNIGMRLTAASDLCQEYLHKPVWPNADGIQLKFNGSNIFEPMAICSRHGYM